MVGGYGVGNHLFCTDTFNHCRLQLITVWGLPAHVKAFQAPGIVGVRHALLDCLTFKLCEYDTYIQHGPSHRGRGVEFLGGGNKLHIVLLKQFHHVRKIQNGAADPVQLIDDYPPYPAFPDFSQQLLKLRPVRVFPGIAFILEYLTAPAFQFVLAKVNLAFNADTVLSVY